MYDVAPVTEATSGVERAIAGDLAQASAAGADITVDLTALYAYYNKLVALDMELDRQLERISPTDLIGPQSDDAGSGAPSGVASAFRATRQAREGSTSLYSSVRTIQSQVRQHLDALRHNYNSYMAREGENVAQLNTAIPWADKPLGW